MSIVAEHMTRRDALRRWLLTVLYLWFGPAFLELLDGDKAESFLAKLETKPRTSWHYEVRMWLDKSKGGNHLTGSATVREGGTLVQSVTRPMRGCVAHYVADRGVL